ncbi:MAG: hypothetical protein ACXABE_02530, partial [Candidatus Thorarchaeota archaeon]
GQTVIWKSWERYYRPDGVTPKDGISSVQLHETMHAVGFHHTWQHEHYSSDFSWGPMGYFAFREGTATYDKNWVQGTYLDQMEAILWDELMNRPQTEFDRPETELAEARAHIAFNTARELYDEMDWMGAYEALLDAKDWIRRVYSSIMDSTPPVIHDWGTLPEGVGTDEFIYWAEVSDDLAGLENVTLFVQVDEGDIQPFLCSNSSDDWSVTVPSQNTYTNLTMWLVAHDWGMNSISGGRIEVLTTPFGSFSDLLIPLAVAAGTSCVVIGIGVYLMKRRQ